MTLVELLVVVAIIISLMALLLPAVQSAREAGRRGVCANNLKQLALAACSQASLTGQFPTGGWSKDWIGNPDKGSDWRQPGGWCFTILPFIEQKTVYDLAGTDPATMVSMNVPGFTCPTRRTRGVLPVPASGVTAPTNGGAVSISAGPWMHTDYAGNRGSWSSESSPAGSLRDRPTQFMPLPGITMPSTYPDDTTSPTLSEFQASLQTVASTLNTAQVITGSTPTVPTGGVIFAGSSVAPAMIRDGLSNTYLFGEKYVPRAAYDAGTVDDQGDSQCAYVGDSPDTLRAAHRGPESDATPYTANLEAAFGGPHPSSFNVALCDGSVRPIAFDVAVGIHFVFAARADRQAVQQPD